MNSKFKSKCCKADARLLGTKPGCSIPVYVCEKCLFTCDIQDQPNSRLDEVAERYADMISNAPIPHPDHHLEVVKAAIQEYTSDLQQSLVKANEELVESRKDKERFEWCIKNSYLDDLVDGFTGTQDSIRQAIDKAMKSK